MQHAQLIVNPVAGRAHGPRLAPLVAACLRRRGYSVSCHVTRAPGDARAFVRALRGDTRLLVVMGGDGTLHEVINGRTDIPIVVVPTGAGNVFAADQGLRLDPGGLEALLRDGVVAHYDAVVMHDRLLLSGGSAGIIARVHHRIRSRRQGPQSIAARLHTAWRVLREEQFPPLTVSAGNCVLSRDARLVVFANTAILGCCMSLTPRASPFDGLVDVLALPAPARLDAVRWTARALLRTAIEDPGVHHARTPTVRVDGAVTDCEADGECLGRTPCSAWVCRRCVPVLVPAASHLPADATSPLAA